MISNLALRDMSRIPSQSEHNKTTGIMTKKKRKNKKRKHSPKGSLIHYKIGLFKNSSPRFFLSKHRDAMSPFYSEVIDFAKSVKKLRDKIFDEPFPSSATQLKVHRALASISIDHELKWTGVSLSKDAQKLGIYLDLVTEYERSIINRDYLRCEEVLNKIESTYGYSLWLIKNRIALLQVSKGLEAQKRYAADIKKQSGGIVAFITHYVSYRVEESVSAKLFSQQFHQILSVPRISDRLRTYLTFHIIPGTIYSPTEIVEILPLENAGAVIDYYETFLAVAKMIIAAGDSPYFQSLVTSLQLLSKELQDPRISILLFDLEAQQCPNIEIDPRRIEAFDAFLEGDYRQALSIADSLLLNAPEDFDLIEIAARSIALLSPTATDRQMKSPAGPLIGLMSTIVTKNAAAEKTADELIKIAWNFSGDTLTNWLFSFVMREMSPDPLERGNGFVQFASLGVPRFHPLRLMAIYRDDLRHKYARALLQKGACNTNTPSGVFCKFLSSEGSDNPNVGVLSWEEGLLIQATSDVHSQHTEAALDLAKQLMLSPYDYYSEKSIRIVAHCLFTLERIAECVEFIATRFVRNQWLRQILPVTLVVSSIDKDLRKQMASNIALTIFYDMYVRFFGSEFESFRNYAYEDFLLSEDLARPSQLRILINQFDKDMLIYFLRHVCVESVMDCSVAFESSLDLAKERIEVCRLLSDIDSTNVEVYQTEIRDIHRRLMIKKRLREIERSKIYVDIESIKRLADKTLKEQFNRYLSFLKDGIDQLEITLRQRARETFATGDVDGVLALSLPENEMNNLFQQIIIELRDQFVSNTEHGLDSYLSVRIHHGTFSGQLRSPLEAENLITQRDSLTGEYKANQYWIKKLRLADPQLQRNLNSAFAEFSKHFDELIQSMIADWIQVRKVSTDKGLFNFMIIKAEIVYLSSLVTHDTKFEDFLDNVFGYFLSRIEDSLKIIRDRIGNEAKPKVSELLNSLQARIGKLSLHVEIGDLMVSLGSARTEVQLAFDRVVEWFRLSQTTGSEPFTIEDAISISVDSLRTFYPDFRSEVVISDEMEEFAIKGNLPSFVDILFIVFENIVRHSKVLEPPVVYVKVTSDNNLIVLRIENNVADGVLTEQARNRINGIKLAMRGEQYRESIIREGGTGFHKIKKILTHDFRLTGETVQPTLDFGVQSENRFFVEIAIPFYITSYQR